MEFSPRQVTEYQQRITEMLRNPQCYSELYRPQFHFTPAFNWCNDPNGLVYYDGEYHLFFQHNPIGCEWGNNSWGHAVSPDLLHWEQLPIALWPDEHGTIWSGSGIVDSRDAAGFQTGDESPIIMAYTYAGRYGKLGEPFTQGIAYSSDRGRTWAKYAHNPVLPNQSGGDDRDPKLLWCESTKAWVMVLYLDKEKLGFFTSSDLKRWNFTGEINGFYECPDLFELPLDGNPGNMRWILMDASGEYLIGSFDGQTFTEESAKQRSDYGANFYAPQTFNNIPEADGRRIQIAWMDGGKYPGMPFNQQMSFPCELTLRSFPDGIRMCKNPIREIKKLYCKTITIPDMILKPGNNSLDGISGDLFDIQLEIELQETTMFGLRIANLLIQYDVNNQTISCGDATAMLPPEFNRIKLRALIDRTSVEVFGNDGRISMSSCYLPQNSSPGNPELFVRGGNARIVSLAVHPLKSIWHSRDQK
ncbi:glycoside hydrolase family 32 protein [Candidatus Neomarinimicrobiota bacterium]